MSLSAKVDAGFRRVAQEIKELRDEGSGGGLSEEEVQDIVDAKHQIVTAFPQAADMVPGVLYLRVNNL